MQRTVSGHSPFKGVDGGTGLNKLAHGSVWTISCIPFPCLPPRDRMSVNHTSMTTHAVPHSLPSFAAAFPPIHNQMDRDKARLLHRSPSSRELSRNPSDDDTTSASRKRPHIDDERRSDSGCVFIFIIFPFGFRSRLLAGHPLPPCG